MISVILPVYNEEKSIGKTIEDIIHNLKKFKLYKSSEIIVVKDGSIDSTSKVLEKYLVKVLNTPFCMGYGYSLKKGISEAQYETIIITDADSTYPFDSISLFRLHLYFAEYVYYRKYDSFVFFKKETF